MRVIFGSLPIAVLPIIAASLGGCAGVTPRQNWVDHMNVQIGEVYAESERKIEGNSWFEHPISKRPLANANVEYTFDDSGVRGRCVYVREVDRRASRIIAWRTEGDDSGCEIVP